MRKQKLSPEASKAKAIRDKKIAMTGHRKKRKNENERMGQRPDSDIHHTKDGKQVRVPINKNRGNFGKGTKSEGPNMMGQTWLNRRIKGPNAEGDPVKKKYVKGGETNQFHPNFVPPPKGTIMPITGGYTPPQEKNNGVKPYRAIDMADYNKRQQLYSDSLSANIATENIAKTIKSQGGGQWASSSEDNYGNSYKVSRKKGESLRGLTGFGFSGDSNVDRALKSDNAADAVSALFGGRGTERSTIVYQRLKEGKPTDNYTYYSDVKGVKNSINKLKITDKSLGKSNKSVYYSKKRKSGESIHEHLYDTSISTYFTGDRDDSVVRFGLPYRPKPKQEILPPLSKNKPTITKSVVKKKPRPKDTISKMPIGKLKSKSTAPKKLSNRKPENFVYYDKPKKTSLAITGNPGSKARYATVNRGDKKGNIYLTKKEYDKEMKNTFIKIK
mgnify:FL=1